MEKNNAKSVSCGANMRKMHEKIMMTHMTQQQFNDLLHDLRK